MMGNAPPAKYFHMVVLYRVGWYRRRPNPRDRAIVTGDQRLARELPAQARFLLELDNATHDNPRFGRDKVAPGIA